MKRGEYVRRWRLATCLFRLALQTRSSSALASAERILSAAGIDPESVAHERDWERARDECGHAAALMVLVAGFVHGDEEEINAAEELLNSFGGRIGRLKLDLANLLRALDEGGFDACRKTIANREEE